MAIPTKIKQLANDVRTKIYGRDVRESIAKGMEESGDIADESNTRSKSTADRQDHIESRYDIAVGAHTQDSEVLDSRLDSEGRETHDNLANRLIADFKLLLRRIRDVGITANDYGLYGDGINDDTDKLQQALNEENNIIVPTGLYLIKSKLIIPKNKKVHFNQNSKIILENDNACVEIRQKAFITGHFIVETLNPEYSGSAVYFDGTLSTGSKDTSFENTFIDNLEIVGHETLGMGNALHFKADKAPSTISFIKIENLFAKGFEKNIFVDVPPLQSEFYNYVNGNIINNAILKNADYYIYSTGDQSSLNQAHGNMFKNVQMQWAERCKKMLHFEGRSNEVNGYTWDIGHKEALIFELSPTSQRNKIELNMSDAENWVDEGINNFINFRDINNHIVPIKGGTRNNTVVTKIFQGDYEDILFSSPIVNKLEVLGGSSYITNGDLNNAFYGRDKGHLRLDLSSNREFSYLLTFNGDAYGGNVSNHLPSPIQVLGFYFEYGRVPKEIVVEVININGKTSVTTIHSEQKKNEIGIFMRSNTINGLLDAGIKSIKVTFKGQVLDDVRLSRMFANSYGLEGTKYIQSTGGKMLGDLDFKDSYIKPTVRPTQPANHINHHRKMAIVDTPDGEKLMICLKNADSTYQWVALN